MIYSSGDDRLLLPNLVNQIVVCPNNQYAWQFMRVKKTSRGQTKLALCYIPAMDVVGAEEE